MNKEGNSMAKVQLKTSMGDITLTLDDELAPKSTENFLAYVRSGQNHLYNTSHSAGSKIDV